MTLNIKNKHNGQKAPTSINLQDLLVKASQDAEIAKSAVKEVFSQALRKRKESINELETPANINEEIEDNGLKSHEMPPGNSSPSKLIKELDTIKRELAAKKMNHGNPPRNAMAVPPKEIVQPTDKLIDTVSLAREKIRKSREEAETYKKNAQAAVVALEDKEAKMKEKLKVIKQQLLISIREAQAKAQKAHDEAETIRRESWAAIKQAKMENRKIIEDAKIEVINAQEVAKRAKKEAELAISRVNDTMMEVQQEIIGITINEMSETWQELEEVAKSPGMPADNIPRASTQNFTQNQLMLKFDLVIQLWQNIKQKARYIFYTIKTRFYSKGL
jgi:hypothetical protein